MTTPMLNPLIAAFAGSVALMAPGGETLFTSSMEQLSNHEHFEDFMSSDALSASSDFWFSSDDWRSSYRPYAVVNGVLQIPIRGILLNDFPWQYASFATGYQYIWRAFERGMADPEVKGIALMINTPGGAAAECFDTVDRMVAMRGTKPVRAFAFESAYSAGYALASAADKIIMSRTGGVGSVGVVTSHIDLSELYARNGVKVTLVHAGKHKVDGNPYEALPADVKARIQGRIDTLYDVFVATVANNRGLKEEEVRATEALTYSATDALSVKFADEVGMLEDAFAAFAADIIATDSEESIMTDKNTVEDARAEGFAAGREEGLSAGTTAGLTEGAKLERARISAIIGSDEGKKRPNAALSTALKTAMTAEEATSFLADLAEEKAPEQPAAKGNGFVDHMNSTEQPDVGKEGDGKGGTEGDDLASSLSLARGFGLPGMRAE